MRVGYSIAASAAYPDAVHMGSCVATLWVIYILKALNEIPSAGQHILSRKGILDAECNGTIVAFSALRTYALSDYSVSLATLVFLLSLIQFVINLVCELLP